MISRWKRDEHSAARPLSNLAIALGAVVVLGIGAAAFTVLLWFYGGAGLRTDLDVIRTAGALTVAAGGAATLLLAARRQVHTERDTSEQRITELYTRAVDQLGAEKAPVRLGGLHALERLAQNNPTQRQTIVDVICSYLRMPYTPPPDHPHTHSGVYRSPGPRRRRHRTLTDRPPVSPAPTLRYRQAREEGQVRLTAQRILSAHLKPEAAEAFWGNIDLDLTEAHLHQLDLSACRIRRAVFDRATFIGGAAFGEVTFAGDAVFSGVTFAGETGFASATFAGTASFDNATFAGDAWCVDATFAGNAVFSGVKFAGDAAFEGAEFAGYAGFSKAEFAGYAWFSEAEFTENAWFNRATFTGTAGFDWATFTGHTEFEGARVASSSRHVVLPMGWTTRVAQPAEGEAEGWLYVVRDDEDSSEQPADAPDNGEGGSDGETGT